MDADCLVAGTLTPTGATTQLLDLWRDGEIELVVCPRLLEEVRRTLLDPRIAKKYRIARSDVDGFVDRLNEEGVRFDDPVEPPRVVPADPNDDYLVALAVDAGAEFFVTRDHHFDHVEVRGLRIIAPGRLLREFR